MSRPRTEFVHGERNSYPKCKRRSPNNTACAKCKSAWATQGRERKEAHGE